MCVSIARFSISMHDVLYLHSLLILFIMKNLDTKWKTFKNFRITCIYNIILIFLWNFIWYKFEYFCLLGTWSIQFDRGSGLIVLRSLLWPGYVFYHVPGTRRYGSLYVGIGEKNLDLPFMLWWFGLNILRITAVSTSQYLPLNRLGWFLPLL